MVGTFALPILDLEEWRTGSEHRRAEMSAELDASLRRVGMLQLTGHGLSAELREEVRSTCRPFFALPEEAKQEYSVDGGTGWRGRVRTSSLYSDQGPPDLHEAFLIGAQHSTGDAETDRRHYPPNRWPTQTPELRPAATAAAECLEQAAQQVLRVLADVLGAEQDFFLRHTDRATWTLSLNWYPSLRTVETVQPGQLRVGAHSDFGSISLLDRQPGVGGLQAWHDDLGWFTPHYGPEALTVLLGDLMHLWTDGRWDAATHRVSAPSDTAPDEELVSLVYFYEANPDAVVKPLPEPLGGGAGMAPVVAGDWLNEKIGILNES